MRAMLAVRGLLVVAGAASSSEAKIDAAWQGDMAAGTDRAAPSFKVYGSLGEHKVAPPAAGSAGERAWARGGAMFESGNRRHSG